MEHRFEFEEIGSTQAEAIRRVQSGESPDFRIVARVQRAGLGRLDHDWVSPAGGLYLSAALPALRPPSGLWPVGIGSAVGRGIASAFGVPTLVKWPNDVLASRSGEPAGKLAGILVDRVTAPTGEEAVIVGLGVNCSTSRADLPEALSPRSAILSELAGRPIGPREVEPVALEAIERTADRLSTASGERAVWSECRTSLWGIGRAVRVDGIAKGRMRDLAEDGALLVEEGGSVQAVRGGEIVVEGLP